MMKSKKFLTLLLTALMTTSTVVPYAFAAQQQEGAGKGTLADSIVSITPADGQKVVKPNSPVVITLKANQKVLDTLGITKNDNSNAHKTRFGVLVTDGQNETLATEANGGASVDYDASAGTVKISVQHSDLTRYTDYQVYLLSKDSLNKYNASLNSNGHSAAFEKMIENGNDSSLIDYTFETGSAIGEASQWKLNQDQTGKILTTDGLKVSTTVQDDYGNPATSGQLDFVNATDTNGQVLNGITANPDKSPLVDGKASIDVTSDKTQTATLNFSTEGAYSGDTKTFSVDAQFVAPVPEGSKITVTAQKNPDSTVTISGTVKQDGVAVPEVGVPLNVQNGTLSDSLPVTDASGNFSTTVAKTGDAGAVVSIDSTKAPQVTMPSLGIDPLVYGNQAWTDTAIDITQPNTLIKITQATGSWANNLYAKVGENGVPFKIGSNGGFVSGVAGRLYLGTNGATYTDDVDVFVALDDPKAIGIMPTMNIASNKVQLGADGKSQATISGKVMYGSYPLVAGNVSMSTTLGTVTNATSTDAAGNYSSVFTAGTQAGTATVKGTFDTIAQSVNIDLAAPVTAVDPAFMKTTSTGIQYSTDGGATYKNVSISAEFHGFIYDAVHQVYVGVGNDWVYTPSNKYWNGIIYTSKDGIHWNQKTQLAYNLYAIGTDGKGTIVIAGDYASGLGTTSTVYTSNDGANTWKATGSGYYSNAWGWPPYVTGVYFGSPKSITYDNGSGKFTLTGSYRKIYSLNGYTWTLK